MKHLKTYNESLRDKMTPKSDVEQDIAIQNIYDYLINKTLEDKYTDEKKSAEWYWNHKYDYIVDLAVGGWTKEEIYNEYGSDLEDYFDDEEDEEDDYYTSYNQPF